VRTPILGFMTIVGICLCHAPTLRSQERPPIIDMHLHADLPPHDIPPGAPALCRPEPCKGAGQATANHAETLRTSLEAMDLCNIVKAFLSGVDPAVGLVRAGLGKRLMFGSDQMRWPEKIGAGIEAIEQAPFLTKDQKRDILYHNAVRFLRLEQDARRTRPSKEERL